MNKYKTLLSNTLLISIGTFGSKILVFFMVRFYTGYLTPSDYGTSDYLARYYRRGFPLCARQRTGAAECFHGRLYYNYGGVGILFSGYSSA